MSRQKTTDQVAIRHWVEQRRGVPAAMRRADGQGTSLRIVLPDDEEPASVRPIPWQHFFETFEREQLAFVFDEEDNASGHPFHQLVRRDS